MTDIVERLRSHSPYLKNSSAKNSMDEAADEIVRLRALVPVEIAKGTYALAQEIERLTLENWQLKGALGYPVPGDIPQGPFKCGLCEARALEQKT